MCGRYASARPRHDLLEAFRVDEAHADHEKAPDYNVKNNGRELLQPVPAEPITGEGR